MVLDCYRAIKDPQNANKLFGFGKSLLHVWGHFGCFDVWNYFEQVQNPPNYAAKNINLIDAWVGDNVFKIA